LAVSFGGKMKSKAELIKWLDRDTQKNMDAWCFNKNTKYAEKFEDEIEILNSLRQIVEEYFKGREDER
jgi:hypothetical protein